MKFYDNSAYGFCEICRKTDIPTTFEGSDGSFELICPSCAEATFDLADSILPELCEFGNCVREAISLCTKCMDAVCNFHENKDGMCDACSPMTSQYSRGWSGSY
jgi:hypothetical protein